MKKKESGNEELTLHGMLKPENHAEVLASIHFIEELMSTKKDPLESTSEN